MGSEMKRVAFALYNQLDHKSKEYSNHVRAITMFDIRVSMHRPYNGLKVDILLEGNNVDELIVQAYDRGCNYLYLMGTGYITSDHSLLNRIHAEAEAGQFGIVGHILEDKYYQKNQADGFFQLHLQSFYLNLDIWAKNGKPKFGDSGTVENISLPDYNRSDENIHDNYTPLWITPVLEVRPEKVPSNAKIYSGPVKQGWNLIANFLENQTAVGNFSESIRRSKSYLYPEIDDDRFERILAGEQGITVESTGPTYAQYHYLKETDFTNVTGAVFVFNNDSMNLERLQYYPLTKLNTLYAVAAGFKPLQLLTQVDYSEARVVYIDYSQDALNYRKWLVEHWDGNDYMQAIEQYKQVNPNFDPIWMTGKQSLYPTEWENTLKLFGGKKQWLKLWNKYKTLPHEYYKINLLGDYQVMIEDMKQNHGNNMIWTSNSFNTPATIRNFAPGALKSHWDTFLNDVVSNNTAIQVVGYDHEGGYQTKLHGNIYYE
jgi:hypothetical protein